MNSYKRSLYVSVTRIIANLLMLGAVFLAMYQAGHSPASSLSTFCLWFFGITIPLWIGALFLTRQIARRFPAEQESLVDLPRLGRRLVRWRVLTEAERPTLLFR
ncbi:hypothetical protein [Desulfovibrio sp. SGI.169]|uniref:hypothetical protein n=1 Tax=Desulfovibrio sp. SGI.169 TaxID=3420561 RepID=UPI003D050DDE